MRNGRLVVVAAVMMVSGGALASDYGASVNYGVGGFGIDLGRALIQDSVNVRAGWNAGLSMTGTTTPDTTTYNYTLKTGYKTLGLDWHPFHGSFRVSGGYAWSDINLDVNTSGGYTFNGVSGTGTATGQVQYGNAPYISLGWGNHAPMQGGLFLNAELGAMLTGKPSVSLTTDNAAFNAANAGAIETERNKVRNSALDFVPMVKLGLGYAF